MCSSVGHAYWIKLESHVSGTWELWVCDFSIFLWWPCHFCLGSKNYICFEECDNPFFGVSIFGNFMCKYFTNISRDKMVSHYRLATHLQFSSRWIEQKNNWTFSMLYFFYVFIWQQRHFFWFACVLLPWFSYVTFEISMTFFYLRACVRETRMREDLCVQWCLHEWSWDVRRSG